MVSSETYDGVVMLDGRTRQATIALSRGLVSGHVIAVDAVLEDGCRIEVRRSLVMRLLRGQLTNDMGACTPLAARVRDEHERSFDLLVDDQIVGNLRLGQRVAIEGERVREGGVFGLARAVA